MVSAVAAELARRGDGGTNVLAVTTYFPVDVDSVARVFEALEDLDGVERLEKGALTVYRLHDLERFDDDVDIDTEEFVDEATGFMRTIGMLKRDTDWVEKVRKQHELLRIVADSGQLEIELTYLTSRTSMSRARVQSLLNDFDAQGYIGIDVDEDVERIRYSFPTIDYPEQRYEANMRRLDEVEPPARSRVSPWIILAVIAVIVLMVVMFLRF